MIAEDLSRLTDIPAQPRGSPDGLRSENECPNAAGPPPCPFVPPAGCWRSSGPSGIPRNGRSRRPTGVEQPRGCAPSVTVEARLGIEGKRRLGRPRLRDVPWLLAILVPIAVLAEASLELVARLLALSWLNGAAPYLATGAIMLVAPRYYAQIRRPSRLLWALVFMGYLLAGLTIWAAVRHRSTPSVGGAACARLSLRAQQVASKCPNSARARLDGQFAGAEYWGGYAATAGFPEPELGGVPVGRGENVISGPITSWAARCYSWAMTSLLVCADEWERS